MNLDVLEIVEACQANWQHQTGKTGKASSVVIDSRLVEENSVFLATVGERVDGHSFIKQVAEKQALLILGEKTAKQLQVEYGFSEEELGNYATVSDSFAALKQIAKKYRSKLTLPVVGITGSVGKTSTKEFVAGVLEQKYNVLKTQGNYNNEIGVPLTLLRIREEHTAAVIEMGISDFGEMHRLSEMVQPDFCVITNIGQCHLENLKTRDGILKAKTEIFDFMNPQGTVVLNGDDDKLQTVTMVNGKAPVTFGLSEENRVTAKQTENLGLLGSKVELTMQEGTQSVTATVLVPLPGLHMVKNAACAAAVARLLDVSMEEIAAGLAALKANKGRGEIRKINDITVIDECYNANPASMEAALNLLSMAENYRIAILGDMFELGENSAALHEKVGKIAAESDANLILICGENSRAMYEGAKKAAKPGQEINYYPAKEQLMDAIKDITLIKPESSVLLKASHGMHFEDILTYFENNR